MTSQVPLTQGAHNTHTQTGGSGGGAGKTWKGEEKQRFFSIAVGTGKDTGQGWLHTGGDN